nr:hypothetical protein [Tanacetum cinerariifolium]
MPELLEDATVEAIRIGTKWENDDYICRGHILNDDMSLVQLSSHLRIEESLRAQDNDKGKGKQVGGPSVNMTEEGGKNKHHKQNKGKKQSNENNSGFGSNKKPKLECWKCGKTGHFKRDCRIGKKNNADVVGSGKGSKDQSQDQVEDGFVLYMGDEHLAPVHDKGSVALEFCSKKTVTLFNVLYVPKIRKNLVSGPVLNKCGYKQVYEFDKYIFSKCGVFVGFGYYNNGMFMLNLNKVPVDSDSVYMSSSSTVVNTSLWHARLGHVHNKRMLEMSKDELIPAIDKNFDKCTTCNKKYVITFIDDASRFCYVYLLHVKDEALDKFRIYKIEVELQQNDLIKTLGTDRGGEYYDPVFFQSVGVIHETKAPYTPQQNGVAERKNKALKEMVNSMLSYSGLSEGFWGEAMLTACYLLNRVPNKRNKTTPYELWFYVIEPNDSVSINSIIESKDAVFDDNHFSSIPRPNDIIPNSDESQRDDLSDDVPNEIHKPRKGKRVQKAKSYGFDFQLYLVEGSRDQVGLQYSDCYSIEEDPRTYNEAMQSRDSTFWKEAIDDEIRYIMENNTWVLSDLPPGCKRLGCKWIFKKNMKVAGSIDKFKARLVIQGFRQKERINYFDTYAPLARITTIRLLLALAAIHNLVIHQMFSMKDMGEADVILGIKIKRENKGIVITQSHYIKKILKKFNREDCSSVRTPMDPVEKLKPNIGKPVDQLEYLKAIGFLMYAMTSTRPDIAYDVGRLNRFTSNPSRQHWKAITRIFKYLRGTKDYGLSYVGYPSALEGYSNASWINQVEDSSSTSGWVFLLGGGDISWASKKQTCITGSTMQYEFVALAAAGKEA